ncbi:hypothetical protein BaRGS_00009977 [Batillaria attramentaria]|uniref:Uncharacterized protein n=1 Tax=Batillaria attramentaria TaxID=370345 RepID=A0ABD0LHK2_9CAEN
MCKCTDQSMHVLGQLLDVAHGFVLSALLKTFHSLGGGTEKSVQVMTSPTSEAGFHLDFSDNNLYQNQKLPVTKVYRSKILFFYDLAPYHVGSNLLGESILNAMAFDDRVIPLSPPPTPL